MGGVFVTLHFPDKEDTEMPRPPLPPLDETAAIDKFRLADDAWNSRNPGNVNLHPWTAYSVTSRVRDRARRNSTTADTNVNQGFDDTDLMRRQNASIYEHATSIEDRNLHCSLDRRPDSHPEPSNPGL